MEDAKMAVLHVITFLLLLHTVMADFTSTTTHVDSTGCSEYLEKKCLCRPWKYYGEQKLVVNCTNSGFTNSSVLEHIPEGAEVLIFTGNNISVLPMNVFGTTKDFSKLTTIDMSNNNIKYIRGKAFHRVPNVELLILDHNNIDISGEWHHPRILSNFYSLRELHLTNAFSDNDEDSSTYLMDLHSVFRESNLSKLEKLHLEQNEIWSFNHSNMFCELPNLMDLHLGQNKLSVLNLNLTCLSKLRYLDLEYNLFSRFPNETLRMFDDIGNRNKDNFTVDLRGNPFMCDCLIKDLFSWIHATNVTLREKELMTCHDGEPKENAGVSITEVQEIKCAMVYSKEHDASVVVLGLLVIVLAVLLLVVAYMNRSWVKHRLHPLYSSVTRKVQYSTIQRNEEQEMDV